MIGAGTGLIYILRWFWWRINAWSEITAMVASLIVSISLLIRKRIIDLLHDIMEKADVPIKDQSELISKHFGYLLGWEELMLTVLIVTIIWISVTLITKPDDEETLRNFVKKVNPGGPGWAKYSDGVSTEPWPVPRGILSMVLGCIAVYGFLLGIGQLLYGETGSGLFVVGLGIVASVGLFKVWKK
jgi:hypothetical protein